MNALHRYIKSLSYTTFVHSILMQISIYPIKKLLSREPLNLHILTITIYKTVSQMLDQLHVISNHMQLVKHTKNGFKQGYMDYLRRQAQKAYGPIANYV